MLRTIPEKLRLPMLAGACALAMAFAPTGALAAGGGGGHAGAMPAPVAPRPMPAPVDHQTNPAPRDTNPHARFNQLNDPSQPQPGSPKIDSHASPMETPMTTQGDRPRPPTATASGPQLDPPPPR